jgi:hypothetical protein
MDRKTMKAFGRRLAIMGTVASLAVGGAFAVNAAASADEVGTADDCVNNICTVTVHVMQGGAFVANLCFWNDTGNFGQCTGYKGANNSNWFDLSVQYHADDNLSVATHALGETDNKHSGNAFEFMQNPWCTSGFLTPEVHCHPFKP